MNIPVFKILHNINRKKAPKTSLNTEFSVLKILVRQKGLEPPTY